MSTGEARGRAMDRLAARLNRADCNLGMLEQACDEFLTEGRSYRFTSDHDVNTGDLVCYAELFEEPPVLDWASIIGDVVHDLRATLDNLVWELSILFGPPAPLDPIPSRSPWRRVGFPIVTDEPKWAPSSPSSPLWAVHPSLFAEFRKVQPFLTRPHAPARAPLAVLQELSNIDKHRHVHVIVVSGRSDPKQIVPLPAHGRAIVKEVSPLRELKLHAKTPLFTIELIDKVPQRVDLDWHVGLRVAFDYGPPAYGLDTIDFLREVKATIARIITVFEGDLA